MSEDNLINRTLDGFQIISLLGRGGMARVYQGIDTNLRRYVAIKVIDTPHLGEAEYIKRFQREAQVIAQLNHPNVVQIYHTGEAEGYLYIVMQYIQGADLEFILSDYRKDGEFILPDEAIKTLSGIADALDYIHSKGVIHRDVKPSNILLTKEGQAILSDFGLALLTEVGTLGEIFGSPEYISPEQAISSANAGPQSDQYSLAVIAYEMLTGRLPFKSANAVELAMQHVTDSPPNPRDLRPEITPEVEGAILRALSKKPEERYSSCSEFIKTLSGALKTMSVEKPSTPPTLTHVTIPERVKLHRVANPMPPIPILEQGGTDARLAQSGSHDTPEQKQSRQIRQIIGIGGLLLVLLVCLCASGVLLFQSFTASENLVGPQPTQTSALPMLDGNNLDKGSPISIISTPTNRASTATPAENTPTTGPRDSVARILLVKDTDKSMFVINQGPADLPLVQLKLGNPPNQLAGEEWNITAIKPGECVSVWSKVNPAKDKKLPGDVNCDKVGEEIERKGNTRFWTNEFYIYYAGNFVGKCSSNQKDCEFQVDTSQ